MCFEVGNAFDLQFLIEFLIYSFGKLKTQWQVPKESVGVKPVPSPPVSGNTIEMPAWDIFQPVLFTPEASFIVLCLLMYSQFLFLPMLELKAISGIREKSSIHCYFTVFCWGF